MEYEITIKGTQPIIQNNGAAGLDTRSPAKIEIAEINSKKGKNRTVTDDERLRELECQISLYFDAGGAPTIPEAAIRTCIETDARKMKQGSQVREGLIVTEVVSFDYDRERYGTTVDELVKSTQFTVPVKMGQVRVNRTRAKFDDWSVTFRVDIDPELVDKDQLDLWLDIAGRRIGLGDWRPEKSGTYGRFETVNIKEHKPRRTRRTTNRP